ncbi:MAG: ABC transporter substrate-binding protein, partial [Pseudomonadota bacterium]|nr:ABC transporter substrate-binding protein [Pseudomonadota bacterium]
MFVKISALIVALVCGGGSAVATNKANVVGNPKAPKGGTFVWGGASYPKSLNYPVSGDYYSALLYSLVVETLCEQDPSTGDYVPLLANKWEISEDKKVFTFHIDKKAKFSDGAAVSAHDFKAFWDIVHDKKNLVGNIKAQFDKFSKMEVVDDHTLKVYAKEVRFSNFDIMCSYMFATDRRFWLAKGKDFNKAFNSKLFGS